MLYYTFEESTYFLKRSNTSIVFWRRISYISGNQSKFLIIEFFPHYTSTRQRGQNMEHRTALRLSKRFSLYQYALSAVHNSALKFVKLKKKLWMRTDDDNLICLFCQSKFYLNLDMLCNYISLVLFVKLNNFIVSKISFFKE